MSVSWASQSFSVQSSATITLECSGVISGSRNSFGLRAKAVESLYDLAERCKQENWDGDGAEAITDATYQKAYLFLETLPIDLPAPDFIPEPDGHIAMEWYRGRGRLIVLSIGEDGEIHYSFTLGDKRGTGCECFAGSVSRVILNLIHKVLGR
jgi:hypothetical protein